MASKLFFFFALVSCSLSLSAQNANLDNLTVDISDEIITESDWTFFSSEDQNQIYIDLEALGGYATDLSLSNESGDVLLSEELNDIPKNSIYELDLAVLEKGSYSLKVRTYQDVVEYSVRIK